MRKKFGVHHTHHSHPTTLVVVEGGKVKEVLHQNTTGQVFVADLDALATLPSEERAKAVLLGVSVKPVTHAELEKFLEGIINPPTPETPPAPPLAESSQAPAPPTSEVPVVAAGSTVPTLDTPATASVPLANSAPAV